MSWIDHTPECWTAVPPLNDWETRGANAGMRWLLPPQTEPYPVPPVIGFLNFNLCCGVDNWSCDQFPPELQSRGINFPKGSHLAAAGWMFGPKVLGPAETLGKAQP